MLRLITSQIDTAPKHGHGIPATCAGLITGQIDTAPKRRPENIANHELEEEPLRFTSLTARFRFSLLGWIVRLTVTVSPKRETKKAPGPKQRTRR